MTTVHDRLLAALEQAALDAGVARHDLDAHVADELRVPLDHYAAYLLVSGAVASYQQAHPHDRHPAGSPARAVEARLLRRLWEQVGAIHEAAVAGGEVRVVVRDHARQLIRDLLALSEQLLAHPEKEERR